MFPENRGRAASSRAEKRTALEAGLLAPGIQQRFDVRIVFRPGGASDLLFPTQGLRPGLHSAPRRG